MVDGQWVTIAVSESDEISDTVKVGREWTTVEGGSHTLRARVFIGIVGMSTRLWQPLIRGGMHRKTGEPSIMLR
jgi:hypothetical protein